MNSIFNPGAIEVFEDDMGRIRLYLHECGRSRAYDCWERCDFADLRKCIYEWISLDIMAGVECTYSVSEERDDKRYNRRIVSVYRDPACASSVTVNVAFMGHAGRHAWGIKEAK